MFVDHQIHAVHVAHRQAEKDASSWQRQLEHSQVQHQKQVKEAKNRCNELQAERNALTMVLSAVAAELVRMIICIMQADSSAPSVSTLQCAER